MKGRLIVDPPENPAWNMGADQAILDSVTAGGPPVLRLYQWNQPTLSLGYFQLASERTSHLQSQSLTLVRRSTGGGAIVHDRELTYSLSVPIVDRARREVEQIYETVHAAIRSMFAEWGIRLTRFAELPGQTSVGGRGAGKTPFLCFQRRTEQDLTIAGYKVVGSAQRRSAKAVLQHGSILLHASEAAPQLPGINDLTMVCVGLADLLERFPAMLASQGSLTGSGGIDWERSAWQSAERTAATAIAQERFAQPSWNQRR